MESPVCAFSGHRPEKLPWGNDEQDERCLALKQQLREVLLQLCRGGCRRYICGTARGTDLYFLELLLELKREYPLEIEAAIPCPSQSQGWSKALRERYARDLAGCDLVSVLEDHYSPGCMLRRNRYMVDRADMLLTVYDGSPGGTAATVAYAEEKGVSIIPLWR